MYEALISFYKYGFIIFKNVPTENNFLVKFANSIGSIRRTNFGEFFNVKSKPNPNDLAYTSLPLAPHTDNPYRNPVPCIQILHCIENAVEGGHSTLVDGFTVTEDLKEKYPEYYKNAQAGKIAILGPGDTSHFNIQYKNMHSTGNCVDFGHTIGIRRHAGVGSDKTTAVFLGGYDPSAYTNDIETVIFSSKGNSSAS